MRLFIGLSVAFSLLFSLVSSSLAHEHLGKRHHVKRHEQELSVRALSELGVWKRFDGVRLTFYTPGLGACGQVNTASDFIVALSVLSWDDASSCFQQITITANGVTQSATIMDKCMGCPPDGLDLSPALFTAFTPLSAGVLTGSWGYGSGSPPPPSSSPPPPPPPTTTWQPPSTTWQPSTTTTSSPPPSTTTTSKATSQTTTSSSTTTTGTSAGNSTTSSVSMTSTTTMTGDLAIETAAPDGGQVPLGSVLNVLDLTLVSIGEFLLACRGQ